MKEGLRKYGRAWGKIYREVGDQKTATQCKQFYDDFCNDELLDLNQALEEHSSMKVCSTGVLGVQSLSCKQLAIMQLGESVRLAQENFMVAYSAYLNQS